MTDDLTTHLRAAGDLLDERGAKALDALADSDGARILPLTPAPSAGGPNRVWLGVAAAALLVVAAAVILPRLGDDSVPVASAPSSVALVPTSVEGWETVQVEEVRPDDLETGIVLTNRIVVVPSGAVDDRSRAVNITIIPDIADERGRVDVEASEEASGSGLTGQVSRDPSGRVQLFVDADPSTSRDVILLTTGPGVRVDELFELAAALEPGTPLSEQTPADGWTIRVAGNGQTPTSVTRYVGLNRPGSGSDETESLTIASVTGAVDDMWLLAEPYLATDAEVRGKPAWILQGEGTVTITWVETSGLVVQVAHYDFESDATDAERLAMTMAVAEDLVAVDQAGWDQFAAQATTADPSGSDADVPTDTTVVGQGSAMPPVPQEALDADARLSGTLDNGGWFHAWVDYDESSLCWELHQTSGGEAGCQSLNPVGVHQIVTDADGVALLVTGVMPEPAEFAEVIVRGGGREYDVGSSGSTWLDRASTSGWRAFWVAPIPVAHELVSVTYFAADGTEVPVPAG